MTRNVILAGFTLGAVLLVLLVVFFVDSFGFGKKAAGDQASAATSSSLASPAPQGSTSVPSMAAVPPVAAYQSPSLQGNVGVSPVQGAVQPMSPNVNIQSPQQAQAQPAPVQPDMAAQSSPAIQFQKPLSQLIQPEKAAEVPPNYIPKTVELFEAHWQGLDSRAWTDELRRKLKYPKGLTGILVGEVTLNAAEAGILAGDIINKVGDVKVSSLEEFQMATREVRTQTNVKLRLMRPGKKKQDGRFPMRTLTLVMMGQPDLGMAQVEGAPMILPGDPRPHPHRGVCTNCHTVGDGFELSPDPDLVSVPPPVIDHATVVKGIRPHRDRGPCEACHLIRKDQKGKNP
ncbi:magnetosome magnetite formation protein MamP [Terasakiella sp. SH-1]|uniref:magnetosome magnetite formation protein MamP n=1 Tax=Terasakiella sp. SH-1 TaxID=2560057 RepID=UPI001073BE68|nr:magnetosome magnetite formation protein MamP [Terasakiella sp. SH-1]